MKSRELDSFTVPLEGRNVVTASAGTGKTYAITSLVLRLVVERGLDIRQILVVTFTEAATAELRDRIRRRLAEAAQAYRLAPAGRTGDSGLDQYVARRRSERASDLERLEVALSHLDEAPISTIHGFCLRMLQDGAFESNARYDAELVTDLGPLRDEVLHDAWAKHVAELPLPVLERVSHHLLPKQLRSLVDKITRAPDLEVLPPAAGAWPLLVERARKLWESDKTAIGLEFLSAVQSFVGKQHRESDVRKWFEEVDGFLADPLEEGKVPPGVRRFAGQDVRLGARLAHPFSAACRHLAQHAKAPARPVELGPLLDRILAYTRTELARRKEARGQLSFDDLLLHLEQALAGRGGMRLRAVIREQFRAALVDEFQDTDPAQLAIFESVWGETDQPVFFIGDPKQAIYSFRGADVFTYLSAVSRPGVSQHTMGTSYRSDPSLLDAINAIFEQRPGAPPPFLLDAIESRPVAPREGAANRFHAAGEHSQEPLEVLFISTEGRREKLDWKDGVPPLVAAEVSSLVRSGSTLHGRKVTPGDIAILTRTNDQCTQIQAELRRLGVPAVVLGDKSVFGSDEAREVQRVLAAIVEPTQAELRKALATELLGVSASTLASMETDALLWETWLSRFREWGKIWAERGLVQTFDAVLTEAQVPERLLALVDGERRMTNVLHLLELLRAAADESHLGPAGLLHWLERQRSDTERFAAEHAEIRLESDEAAVKLTTIHKSKGLEYPIVYCPYLWSGWLLHSSDAGSLLFHDPEDGNRRKIDLGSPAYAVHRDQAELESLAENLRLLYVALTRARHRVVLLWGMGRDVETSALAALLHPPDLLPSGAAPIEHYRSRLVPLNEEALVAAWEERRRASGGAIAVRRLDLDRVGVPVPRAGDASSVLSVRTKVQDVRTFPRVLSFSALTRVASEKAAVAISPNEARDHDEQAREREAEESQSSSPDLAKPIVLADFERGATAGVFYHSVLEHLDFREPVDLEARVVAGLRQSGLRPEQAEAVCHSVRDVLATPLLADSMPPFRLADVSRERRLNELEFHLPVADAKEGARPSPRALAAVFAEHPSAAVGTAYGSHLEGLTFSRFEGFLKGFVDLVLEHEGRFYVVDYKTNYLGASTGDYAVGKLGKAMAHGHYFLQYHLYALAVHRYLGRRVKGYDYDAHFGGALYLFVRGMSPEVGPAAGVFFEKPPRARIEALSRLLDGVAARKEGV